MDLEAFAETLATRQNRWDERFMALAVHVAQWSKDPSRKCGAIITDHDQRVRGMGYNGFPRGVADYPERYQPDINGDKRWKYMRVVHAEANAILEAKNCEDMTMYTTFFSCADCAGLIIQAGIKRIVAPEYDEAIHTWGESQDCAKSMYLEAGIELTFL